MSKKKKKLNSLSDLGGMVFSTNENYSYEEEEELTNDPINPNKTKLIIRYETAHRGGKKVTIVSRFPGTEEELKALGKDLKQHCGSGGSIVDDEILVQGDHRAKVQKYLREKGFKTNDIAK